MRRSSSLLGLNRSIQTVALPMSDEPSRLTSKPSTESNKVSIASLPHYPAAGIARIRMRVASPLADGLLGGRRRRAPRPAQRNEAADGDGKENADDPGLGADAQQAH